MQGKLRPIDWAGVILAAIRPGIFSRRDNTLPGSGSSANSWQLELAAGPARSPAAGCKQPEREEPQQQGHTHKAAYIRN